MGITAAVQFLHGLVRMQFLGDALTADPDLAFVFAGLREVIGNLHPQPRFRRASECL
jgi:hypothetical protein